MHVAAQGDSAFSLTYFRNKGISVNAQDNCGSTPLHWACYGASDSATYYLQSWDCEVNIQDNLGNTPLHIAVINAESFVNTRAIKELLIKGSSREIVDNEGRRAVDHVEGLTDDVLKKELNGLLEK